jgi:hypothetical protein
MKERNSSVRYFMQRMVNLGSIFIPKEETCCSMTAFSAGSPTPVLEV